MRPRTHLLTAVIGLALLPAAAGAAISDQIDYGTNAAVAWDAGYTGTGQTVAVIDSGTDARHYWFGGQVTPEACFTGLIEDSAMHPTCPGLGTTAEDVLRPGPQFGPGAAMPPRWGWGISDAAWDRAKTYHGTHVSGIVAGSQTRILGVRIGRRGIAPDANIMAINAFSVNNDGGAGAGAHDVAEALRWVNAQRGAYRIAAVNLSWANDGEAAGNEDRLCRDRRALERDPQVKVRDAINQLLANGIPVVAAAGNFGGTRVPFPACLPNVIAVGATNIDTDDEQVSSSTPSSSRLTVLAPGTSIVGPELDGTIRSSDGSSFAAPIVSAAIAMYKQKYPDATLAKITRALKTTGKPIAVGPGIQRRVLRINEFLGIKRGPAGAVDKSCIHIEFQPADNRTGEHDAFVRLTCAPTARRPGKLVVSVVGPETDLEREYTDIPITDRSYYANNLVKFGVPRFRSEPGSYRTCYSLYGPEDTIWPILSDCREDDVG